MYPTTKDIMNRPFHGCILIALLLLATSCTVQGQNLTAACNVTSVENGNNTIENTICCLNSSTSYDCPDGFFKLNKSSLCNNVSDSNIETTTVLYNTSGSGATYQTTTVLYNSPSGSAATYQTTSKDGIQNETSEAPTVNYDFTVCVQQCPQGMVGTEDKWCVDILCDNNCLTCSDSPSTCTSCRENSELKDGKCHSKFPLAIIIGCATGGAVAVVLIIFIIVICCVKSKKRRKDEYDPDTPNNTIMEQGELNREETRIETTENKSMDNDIYVNGPQIIRTLPSNIQDGHDKVLRYVKDPTSNYLTNTERIAEQRQESAEDLELQSLPPAPAPPIQSNRVSPRKKTGSKFKPHRHLVAEVDDEPVYTNQPDSPELYMNTGFIDDEDYVNREMLYQGGKNHTDATDASLDGNGSDDYENEDVINTCKSQTDEIYVNINKR